MKLRDARPEDEDVLKAIHVQNAFDYDLPKFDCIKVVVDANDRPVVAVCSRTIAEITILVDRTWETPAWRLEAIRRLHDAMELALGSRGIRAAACWLAPKISRRWSQRLSAMFGWKQADWLCMRLER